VWEPYAEDLPYAGVGAPELIFVPSRFSLQPVQSVAYGSLEFANLVNRGPQRPPVTLG
jgi:hypothetical protein